MCKVTYFCFHVILLKLICPQGFSSTKVITFPPFCTYLPSTHPNPPTLLPVQVSAINNPHHVNYSRALHPPLSNKYYLGLHKNATWSYISTDIRTEGNSTLKTQFHYPVYNPILYPTVETVQLLSIIPQFWGNPWSINNTDTSRNINNAWMDKWEDACRGLL